MAVLRLETLANHQPRGERRQEEHLLVDHEGSLQVRSWFEVR